MGKNLNNFGIKHANLFNDIQLNKVLNLKIIIAYARQL